jgi:group I intron endonuclease
VFIYAITNDVNDKAYVGLHTGRDLRKRWSNHLASARMGESCALYNAIRKYGENKFHITAIWSGYILPDKLKILERYYIRCFQTMSPNGYNLTEGGDGSFGFKHSEETKEKLRIKKGRFSEETRARMREGRKRWRHSAEHRRKISKSLKGNKHLLGHFPSAETRAKISAASKGRVISQEAREKRSIALKGKVQGPLKPETIEKIRIANTGKKRSPESCMRMSIAMKGKPKSEETKKKLSKASKKWWEEKRKLSD